jgi:hypothetical protein
MSCVMQVPIPGAGATPSLISITVYGGPHDTVLIEITACPYKMESLGRVRLKVGSSSSASRPCTLSDTPKDLVGDEQ